MSTKFEQLLDYLVNEEMDKANELFHEIVVEKSRDIYENLIAEEDDEDTYEAEDEQDESVDEAADDEEAEESVDESADEDTDESMDLEDSYMMDGDDEEPEDGGMEKTGDFGADVGATDDEMDGQGGEQGAIMDIKSAIAELEAAFAELEQAKGMGGDNSFGDDDMGPAMGDEPKEDEMMGMHEGRRMTREYVEKVGNDWEKNSQKTPGPVGSGKGDQAGQTSVDSGKSPVSSGKGKPTTGATAKNIAQGATGEGAMDGTSPNGKTGGLVKNPQDMKTGNGNVPGGSMGIKNLSKVTQNSKSSGPVGSGTGDKAGQTGGADQAKSPLNGAPNRNA
jgi:hypothetical protein